MILIIVLFNKKFNKCFIRPPIYAFPGTAKITMPKPIISNKGSVLANVSKIIYYEPDKNKRNTIRKFKQ